jgi:hypothetical protein
LGWEEPAQLKHVVTAAAMSAGTTLRIPPRVRGVPAPAGPPWPDKPVGGGQGLDLADAQVQDTCGWAEDAGLLQEHAGAVGQLDGGRGAFGVAGVQDLVDQVGRQGSRFREGGDHVRAELLVGHGYLRLM